MRMLYYSAPYVNRLQWFTECKLCTVCVEWFSAEAVSATVIVTPCFHCSLRWGESVAGACCWWLHLKVSPRCKCDLHISHTGFSHRRASLWSLTCMFQSHRASPRQRSVPSLASRRTCLLVFRLSTQELCMTVPPGEGSTWSRDTTLFLTLARRARRSFCRVKAYSSGWETVVP